MVLVSLHQALDLQAPWLQLSTAEEGVLAEKELVGDLEGVLEVRALVMEGVSAVKDLDMEVVSDKGVSDMVGVMDMGVILDMVEVLDKREDLEDTGPTEGQSLPSDLEKNKHWWTIVRFFEFLIELVSIKYEKINNYKKLYNFVSISLLKSYCNVILC